MLANLNGDMIVNSENNNRTQHGIYDFFGIKETINL
jgi:hypothetical protein